MENNRREIQNFASMKAFHNFQGMTKLPTCTAITDHLSFPLLLVPEHLHTITALQVSFSVCCENCFVRLSLLFRPESALCFGKLLAGICYPSEPRCQAYDAAFSARASCWHRSKWAAFPGVFLQDTSSIFKIIKISQGLCMMNSWRMLNIFYFRFGRA